MKSNSLKVLDYNLTVGADSEFEAGSNNEMYSVHVVLQKEAEGSNRAFYIEAGKKFTMSPDNLQKAISDVLETALSRMDEHRNGG